jgi:hypothetical protein
MPRRILFFGEKAELVSGRWVSKNTRTVQLINIFPLPDDFMYVPNPDFSWVNYLSEQFPKDVVVIENPLPEAEPGVIY